MGLNPKLTEYKSQWEARALSFLASVVSLASEKECPVLVSEWMNTWINKTCLKEKKYTTNWYKKEDQDIRKWQQTNSLVASKMVKVFQGYYGKKPPHGKTVFSS